MPKSSAQLDAEIKAALNGAKDGILARGKTYDDKVVLLWSDGSLTWALGNGVASVTALASETALPPFFGIHCRR